MIAVTAAHVFVPQHHSGNGVMVALAPPRRVVDDLHQEGGEPAHDLHVTLAYLGKKGDYKPDHLADLPGHVAEWAQRHPAPSVNVHGSGTFLGKDDQSPHVLHALVNAPGLHRMQSDLVDHLKTHGYNPSEDYGFLPHMTLGYVKHPVRFLPKVQRQSWQASHVWSVVGGNRQAHPFAKS